MYKVEYNNFIMKRRPENKSGRMRWAGHVAQMGKNAYRIFVGKPEEPLGRPRRRWADNIKMDLR
jgi:hypothetical protein